VHALTRSEIQVNAGDDLEVAHWQHDGDWLWGARFAPPEASLKESAALLLPYLTAVKKRLKRASGPPLKMYAQGASPLRTAVSLYSMVLNGYRPAQIFLFGEYQWSDETRELFTMLLPFVKTVPTDQVLAPIEALGGPELVAQAQNAALVMKACVSLLCAPHEFCYLDDDIFVLDSVDQALKAFEKCNLVFAPDANYEEEYLATWGQALGVQPPLPTRQMNAGFYCLRNSIEPQKIAANLLRVPFDSRTGWLWEQGFMASQFAHAEMFQLPSQRYFYPYFDGLPGGIFGYDYAQNPCGFVTIHFGGLAEKPSDFAALILAPEILRRRAV
jgi:hypothetical protein